MSYYDWGGMPHLKTSQPGLKLQVPSENDNQVGIRHETWAPASKLTKNDSASVGLGDRISVVEIARSRA